MIRDLHSALEFATLAHGPQVRKYTLEPYINHPIRVDGILRNYGSERPPMFVRFACLLHDVLEDTNVTEEELRRKFAGNVCDLVVELTDTSKPEDGNRKVRKEIDRNRLATVSPWAQTIKCADMIDNTVSIRAFDPEFYNVYAKEKLLLLDVLTEADPALKKKAYNVMGRFE